jgi:hypothetical protein
MRWAAFTFALGLVLGFAVQAKTQGIGFANVADYQRFASLAQEAYVAGSLDGILWTLSSTDNAPQVQACIRRTGLTIQEVQLLTNRLLQGINVGGSMNNSPAASAVASAVLLRCR